MRTSESYEWVVWELVASAMLASAKTGVAWTSRRAVRTVREEGTEKEETRQRRRDKEDENYDEEKRA